MKKTILTIGLFIIAGLYNDILSQSIYTDVYNAYQTLSGHEDKTIDTDNSKTEYTKEKSDAEDNLSRQKDVDTYDSKEEKEPKVETNTDPEY